MGHFSKEEKTHFRLPPLPPPPPPFRQNLRKQVFAMMKLVIILVDGREPTDAQLYICQQMLGYMFANYMMSIYDTNKYKL